MTTDHQVRRLRMLIQTEETQAIAAGKAGMDEKTARKYLKSGVLPSPDCAAHGPPAVHLISVASPTAHMSLPLPQTAL